MNLDSFNQLPADETVAALSQCCVSHNWIEQMVNARPFASVESLHASAVSIWQSLTEADFLEAFDGHPKIGDVGSLKKKYASTKGLASGEQSAVKVADEQTLEALASGNKAYEQKFGFIFIVCATGKSAIEMLDLLQARLGNDRQTELKIAAAEQGKITAIRLNKMLEDSQ